MAASSVAQAATLSLSSRSITTSHGHGQNAHLEPLSSPTGKPGPLTVSTTPSAPNPTATATSNVSTPTTVTSNPPPTPITVLPPKVSLRPAVAPSKPPPAAASRPVNKMSMSNVVAPAPEPAKLSMTTKEWVIPPRPKPGRKPATDTPPTKRKAQNRAAQRAFRERRAARVGELEEQLDEQREQHETVERELRERAQGLEMELQTFKSRCVVLESMLERERGDRARIEAEVESLRRKWSSTEPSSSSSSVLNGRTGGRPAGITTNPPNGYAMSSAQSIVARQSQPVQTSENNGEDISVSTRLDPHRPSQPFSISQIISPPEPSDLPPECSSCGPETGCPCADKILANANIEVSCGNCTLGSRCQCLEDILSPSGMQPTNADLKRPYPQHSPSIPPDEKRLRTDAGAMETNLTDIYSKRAGQQQAVTQPAPAEPNFLSSVPQSHLAPRDSCGFCEDGTYCMCAEAASAAVSQAAIVAPTPVSSTTVPISVIGPQTQTPPPSENDAVPPPLEVTSTGAIKLPGFSSLRKRKPDPPSALAKPTQAKVTTGGSGCGEGGPGTCAQCLSDPRSGLFCRSMAANFARQSGSTQDGCCGGSATGGGCCKTKGESPPSLPPLPRMGLSLSCADAYKTLSTHKNFEQASDDIGSWLPKLKAQPTRRDAAGGQTEGRLPIEVEAASIMSVLKEFDIRFGRGQ